MIRVLTAGALLSLMAAGASKEVLWSQKPVVRPAVPAGTGNPIDAFLNAEIRKKGLKMAGKADKAQARFGNGLSVQALSWTPKATS